MRNLRILILIVTLLPLSNNLSAQSLADDVNIRRTDYGVPHILAKDFNPDYS